MNTQKKQGFAAIALVLILSMAAFMAVIPSANAQLPVQPPTKVFEFIGVVPPTLGVHQHALLVWREEPTPNCARSPPLPTDPWKRPIYAENKGWWQVADNWLMVDYDKPTRTFAGWPAFSPYTFGPKSPHILYTKPIVPGGIVG